MFLGLPYSLSKVIVAGDVVAIEDCPRSVSANRHRHCLANTRADHVPDSRPSQVVKQARRLHHDSLFSINDLDDGLALLIEFRLHQPSGFTRKRPGPSRVANGFAISMKHVLRNAWSCRRLVITRSPTSLDYVFQFALKHDFVRPAVLDVFGPRDNDAGGPV